MEDNNKQLEIPAEVRTYIEGLLQDAGMKALDETMHEEMVKELYVRLDNFLTTKIIDAMPPQYIDEFIKLNESKSPMEEIQKYLVDKIPNAQDVFTNAFMEFRDLYLSNVTVARNVNPEEPQTAENNNQPLTQQPENQVNNQTSSPQIDSNQSANGGSENNTAQEDQKTPENLN